MERRKYDKDDDDDDDDDDERCFFAFSFHFIYNIWTIKRPPFPTLFIYHFWLCFWRSTFNLFFALLSLSLMRRLWGGLNFPTLRRVPFGMSFIFRKTFFWNFIYYYEWDESEMIWAAVNIEFPYSIPLSLTLSFHFHIQPLSSFPSIVRDLHFDLRARRDQAGDECSIPLLFILLLLLLLLLLMILWWKQPVVIKGAAAIKEADEGSNAGLCELATIERPWNCRIRSDAFTTVASLVRDTRAPNANPNGLILVASGCSQGLLLSIFVVKLNLFLNGDWGRK